MLLNNTNLKFACAKLLVSLHVCVVSNVCLQSNLFIFCPCLLYTCIDVITFFLFLGHHNATYTVVKTSTGIEFKKVRQIIPIPNAKGNHMKVCTCIVVV